MLILQKPIPPPTNVQVECPSCGAHSATIVMQLQDPMTGGVIRYRHGLDRTFSFMIMLVSGAVSFLLTGALFGPDSGCIALGLTGVLSVGIIAAYTLNLIRRQQSAVRIHSYDCQHCRHKWTWREGTPVPVYDRTREIWDDYEQVFGGPTDEEQ